MVIGLLTFHFVENYGAVLQAYALEKTLTQLGHEVQIIDYRPQYLSNQYKLIDNSIFHNLRIKDGKLFLKLLLANIITLPWRIRKKFYFHKFIQHSLILSKETVFSYEDFSKFQEKYDAIVLGSDQIWNIDITGGKLDKAFFGEFAEKKLKKISYAASVGKDKIDESYKNELIKHLKCLDEISVREASLKKVLEKKYNNITIVCDPVFLLEKKDWDGYIIPQKNVKSYVLIYTLEDNNLIEEYAKKVANFYKIGIKRITLFKQIKHSQGKEYCGIDPLEFLNLIYYSEVIVTNSFHATAFSIIFEKNFYVVSHSTRGSRTTDLLKKYHLSNRIIRNNKQAISSINYEQLKIKEDIAKERKKSLDFLKRGLGNE